MTTIRRSKRMEKKTIGIFVLCLLESFMGAKAQEGESVSTCNKQSYQQFKGQAMQEYNAFNVQAVSEYEQFLAEAWNEYHCFSGDKSAFSSPKPENIPALKLSSGVIDTQAPAIDEVILSTENKPTFMEEDANTTLPHPDKVAICFYGCKLSFLIPDKLRITSTGTRETEVAKYYKTMGDNSEVQPLQRALDACVNRLGLNEWGYFVLLRSLSEEVFSKMNDRVLFCFFMLHDHGFKVRVGRGRNSGQLMLLLALDNSKEVYSLSFFRFNSVKYYCVYGGKAGEDAYSYNERADETGRKEMGLDFEHTLNMATCNKSRSLYLPKVNQTVALPYSTSHLRYYDDMPMTVFPVYFKTGVSVEAEQVLTSTFYNLSQHYNKVQLVDIMLNFVQTAFSYKIDEEQFGREKYFFPEEVIGYPYSDCEDRSALFAWMVRRFAGCEVIGVLYPDHLATGVYFGEGIYLPGKSVYHNGKQYMICDPTYPNAPIGTVMPKFIYAKYEIVDVR